ncbi:MAG TPA: MarR family transcriptional regulator, partial [Telmatospirillum sp.]|nr:MarR family transcriptional regulator [Telmatospirillum sp.]
ARAMTRLYDAHLQAVGLTLTQYSLLSNLIRRAPLSIHDLAAAMGMDRTSLSRTLTPLKDRGMIDFGSAADRRSKVVLVTEEGRRARQAAERHWRAAQDALQKKLGAEAVAEFHRLLDLTFERLTE